MLPEYCYNIFNFIFFYKAYYYKSCKDDSALISALQNLAVAHPTDHLLIYVEIDASLSAKRVTRVLDQIISWRGRPRGIRVDDRTEYTSNIFELWSKGNDIYVKFIQPGRPMQSTYIVRIRLK